MSFARYFLVEVWYNQDSFQTKQSQLPQFLLIIFVLQTLHQISCLSFDKLHLPATLFAPDALGYSCGSSGRTEKVVPLSAPYLSCVIFWGGIPVLTVVVSPKPVQDF